LGASRTPSVRCQRVTTCTSLIGLSCSIVSTQTSEHEIRALYELPLVCVYLRHHSETQWKTHDLAMLATVQDARYELLEPSRVSQAEKRS
jgi:hypothetical protein